MSETTRSRYVFNTIREQLRSHPRPYLDFVFGRHHERPPRAVVEMVREEPEGILKRADPDDLASFRQAASDLLSRTVGVETDPGSILPVPGGRMALGALASWTISAGDRVLVTEPSYPAFARVATQHRAELVPVRLDPRHGFDPDLEDLDEGTARAIRVVSLSYPNNPTGALLGPRVMDALRRRLPADAVWFNDATYAALIHSGDPVSLLSESGLPSVLELYSFAKLFASGPLPIAFLVGHDELISGLREYTEFAWSPMSSLQVRVATSCMRDHEHLERIRVETGERLARLADVLGHLGFEPFPAHGGQYLLCRAPEKIAGHSVRDAEHAAALLLANHDVAAVPWETPPDRYVRFSGMYLPHELEELARKGPLAG